MVIFFVGTVAELIKLFPIMKQMEEEGRPFKIVATGQNDLTQSDLMEHLKTSVTLSLSKDKIKQSTFGVLLWFMRTLLSAYFKMRREMVPERPRVDILVVHGDTVSTLMGSLLGRLLGFRVAHIEAGLRSFKIFSPFPEEICRRLVSKLVEIHFCPNDWAVGNLSQHTGKKICTNGNTLIDSFRYSQIIPIVSPMIHSLRQQPYFVFVIHRQENIYNEALVTSLITQILMKIKDGLTCFMLLHEPTRIAFDSFGLMANLEKIDHLIISPRLKYFEFMQVLGGAEFIVTDGGSNQEETFYLGKPCLILRTATERTEGLGHNVLLSGCDYSLIAAFLADYRKYARDPQDLNVSPSTIVCQKLMLL